MGKKILITGGAGFAGSSLALYLKQEDPTHEIICLDNLKRRGSELNLPRLRDADIRFCHGDVRNTDDLAAVGGIDCLVECSAEPSVLAGQDGSVGYLVQSNLFGAVNCFDHARRHGADVVFLSSSRVYPIPALLDIPLVEGAGRFEADGHGTGWSAEGIDTGFPLKGRRSLYGATKLSAELLLEEYRCSFGIRAVINRFGVLAGPWQMGKVDQGFVALWAARHLFGGGLNYQGFGGRGLQVRDVLHVADMCRLISHQIHHMADLDGHVFNAGGGLARSCSLSELTEKCNAASGRRMKIGSIPETGSVDIPWYVTDNGETGRVTGWRPERSLDQLLEDVFAWLDGNGDILKPFFGGE